MGLDEIVAWPGGFPSGSDGLRVDWRPGGRRRNWLRGFAVRAGYGNRGWRLRGSVWDERRGCRCGNVSGSGGVRCGRRGWSNGAGIQARGDFGDSPATLRVALQAMADNIQEKSWQRVRHDRFLSGGAGDSGWMLRECLDERDAERPDVARRRDDSLRDFRRIIRTRMAEARGGNALLRLRSGRIQLTGVFGEEGNTVAGELELILDGENVGGANVSVNDAFAMEEGERLQRGSENVARFGGSERALRKKLRKIFLGVFHHDIVQIEIAETAAAGVKCAQQMRIGKFGGVLPARQLQLCVGFIDLGELDGNFLRRSAARGQEDSAVLGTTEIALQQVSGTDDLPFPLLP